MLLQRENAQVLMIDVQERLLPAMAEAAAVTVNGTRLLEAARILAVPVLVSEQYPQGLGRTVPDLARHAPANAVHEKIEFSCYANPALRQALSGAGRQTILFGIEAHVCVLQTVLSLLDAGRRVYVVRDAIGSRREESKEAAIRRMERHGADIVTTEMVVFEWLGTAEHPRFREAAALIK